MILILALFMSNNLKLKKFKIMISIGDYVSFTKDVKFNFSLVVVELVGEDFVKCLYFDGGVFKEVLLPNKALRVEK